LQVEELCDDERYRSLRILEEHESRELAEEEGKRAQTNAFHYDYDKCVSGKSPSCPGSAIKNLGSTLRSLFSAKKQYICITEVSYLILAKRKWMSTLSPFTEV
jgi:hypothetical protein